jgi:hypothetical protein
MSWSRCAAPLAGQYDTFLNVIGYEAVLDAGAVFQHASPVAWEYGIPAVIMTRDATNVIMDCQSITLDADLGIVGLMPCYIRARPFGRLRAGSAPTISCCCTGLVNGFIPPLGVRWSSYRGRTVQRLLILGYWAARSVQPRFP